MLTKKPRKKTIRGENTQGTRIKSEFICECGKEKFESMEWCKRCTKKRAEINKKIIKDRMKMEQVGESKKNPL